jgi:hypothetical protein
MLLIIVSPHPKKKSNPSPARLSENKTIAGMSQENKVHEPGTRKGNP